MGELDEVGAYCSHRDGSIVIPHHQGGGRGPVTWKKGTCGSQATAGAYQCYGTDMCIAEKEGKKRPQTIGKRGAERRSGKGEIRLEKAHEVGFDKTRNSSYYLVRTEGEPRVLG